LSLNLRGSKAISDVSLNALVAHVPEDLRGLELDMAFNPLISSAAICKLTTAIAHLESLRLNLHYCSLALTAETAQALAKHMPAKLKTLHLDFGWGDALTDASVAALLVATQRGVWDLQALTLNFESCHQLTDAVLPTLWPKRLRTLKLCFGWCDLTDNGMQRIANGLPGSLQELTLQLTECKAITLDGGVRPLAEALPRTLQRLELELSGCPNTIGAKELLRAMFVSGHPSRQMVITS